MRKILSLLLAVMCFSGVAAQSTGRTITGKTKVAVYVTGKVADEGYRKVIGSKLVTGITNSTRYVAVERTKEFLAQIDKETLREEYVTDGKIAEMGKKLGVDLVLVADISEIFKEIFVSCRMFDVINEQISASAEVSKPVSNMRDLTALSTELVKTLLSKQNSMENVTGSVSHQADDPVIKRETNVVVKRKVVRHRSY